MSSSTFVRVACALSAVVLAMSIRSADGGDCWCETSVKCCDQVVIPASPACTFGNTLDIDGDGVGDLCETSVLSPGLTVHPRQTCSEGWLTQPQAFAGMTSLPNNACRIRQGICVVLSPFSPNTTCIQIVTTLDCRQWVRNDPATDPNAVFNCP